MTYAFGAVWQWLCIKTYQESMRGTTQGKESSNRNKRPILSASRETSHQYHVP